ncbi:helix-turn-helix domain-containing protein [Janibacter melonis]|uniref:Helix-turn-helix domain-containing protein n=1 Tax=Janibacter melonis TaxID=262209 RepID=A0A5P8FL50_9MICO|nr:helix-turn-helix transcriptional regulator [Janibacter melonis]MCB5993016.1 helix-turn-helix domain-containing protein [Janibacter melonis]QFQ29891.2 helix-turn-helix domain-containing protein [Janibacter melonis]
MILLREELGEVLREARTTQGRTLRQISADASISLGYLSEIERGEKEASSELLSSVCVALGMPLSEVLAEVATRVSRAEHASAPVPLRVGGGVSASAA